MSEHITVDNVSKFYGEVLGINRVDLDLAPGITSLVGPNGSGKTTLLNLLTGLIRPTRGEIRVLGISPDQPQELFRKVGYCSQLDSFPRGVTGAGLIESMLWLHGTGKQEAHRLARRALDRVGLLEAADRKVEGFSKGMRQRVKLAQAIAHDPQVLLLDEPLNGLDPIARAEVIALFREFAHKQRHLIISSHILHEVDMLSDEVVLLNHGYVVAEGEVSGIRADLEEQPASVQVRCEQASDLARLLFGAPHTAEVRLHQDRGGLLARTLDADRFYLLLNRAVAEEGFTLTSVTPADEDMGAIYDYLIDDGGKPS